MSRRDTIVVAVLINTGLLLILFVTAINSSEENAKLSYRAPVAPAFSEVVQLSSNPSSQVNEKKVSTDSFESRANEEESQLQDMAQNQEEPQAAQDSYIEVVVKKGDYLEKIAKSHQVEVADIAKLNGLNTTQLQIGQLLRIPILEKVPEKVASNEDSENYYVVRSGDNPWLIAMRNGIELDQLLKLNGLDEKKARRLRPGDKIRIR